ncbi:MAG: PLP-dependent transferase [Chloroflexi bacterium]|nr:PLP-dependent transferase [Chloroflexota bacterium]
MTNIPASYGLGTHAVHVGEGEDALQAHIAPIYQTSTFTVDDPHDYAAMASGDRPGYTYTRFNNPTVAHAERKLAALEGLGLRRQGVEVAAKIFASGMAAIGNAVLARAHAGDHVVLQDQLYGSSHGFFHELMPDFGITFSHFDPHKPGALEGELEAHPNTKLVYVETPANPTLKIVDLAEIAEIAHARGAWVIADNTFATPFCQRPLELGVDVVVQSTTKYLSGHGVIISGAVISAHTDYIKRDIGKIVRFAGPSPSPFDCWLLNLGLKTFEVRMERHCANALVVARHLAPHPKVERVLYPGLETHLFHDVAARQMPGGFGGMLSFELRGGMEAGIALMRHMRLPALAVSLGNVDSMIQHPASMTHRGVPREDRLRLGISDGLVRFSVGIENVEDILDDLDQALKA